MIALHSFSSDIYEHEDTNFPSKWIWSNTGSPYINCDQEHKYAKKTNNNKKRNIPQTYQKLHATDMIALHSISSEIYEHWDTKFTSQWIWSKTGSSYIRSDQEH